MKTIGYTCELELLNVEIMPFTRIMYYPEVDESFRQRINQLAHDCWMAELKTVSKGQRECATFHLRSDALKEDMELLEDMGLAFVPIRKCKRVRGFAHRFYDVDKVEPYDIYGAVAKERRKAEEFKKATLEGDHYKVGTLLGYPKCCIENFIRVWIGMREFDPIWSIARNTRGCKLVKRGGFLKAELKEVYPEANVALRYFGIRAVPHLVCSFTCKESEEFSKVFLQHIRDNKLLIEVLSSPFTWDCYKGVAIITTPFFVGEANSMPFAKRHIVELKR